MTTKSFSVNENNDIYLDKNGNLAISVDLKAVSEIVAQKVKTKLGELIFNTASGIPYFETIWAGTPRALQFQSAIRQASLSLPEVTQVNNFTFTQTGDVFSYSMNIETIYGTAVING